MAYQVDKFNGTTNITVPAAAGTLTGSVLASNITNSNLTEVGTLNELTVASSVTAGSFVGNGANLTNITAANIVGTVTAASNSSTADLATLATTATTASNLAGGSIGSIPYQTGPNTTTLLPVGTVGQVLSVAGADTLTWTSIGNKTVQSVSAGVPSNAIGNNGDIIYQY